MKTLIVDSVEVRTDKNGNDFNVLEISTPCYVYTTNSKGVKTAIKQKPRTVRGITGWLESNLESLKGKPDYEATLEEGDEIQGDIVTRKVVPYFIADRDGTAKDKQGPVKKAGKTGRMVDTASVVVFADTDDQESFDVAAAVAFKRKGHTIAEQSAVQALAISKTTEDPAKVDEDEDDDEIEEVAPKAKQASKAR